MSTPRPDILWLLWCRFSVRHAHRSFRATLTLVFLLSLGVAVVYAVRLANRAAVSGFTLFSEAIAGESDFTLVGPGGRLPMSALRTARETLDPHPAFIFPILEATATRPDTGDPSDAFDAAQFRVVGLDLIAMRNLAYVVDGAPPAAKARDGESNANRPGGAKDIYVTAELAREAAVSEGSKLPLVLGDRLVQTTVRGVLKQDTFNITLPPDLILMDLPALQALTGQEAWIDRIEVLIPEGQDRDQILPVAWARLEAASGWTLAEPESKRATATSMTAAFRLNLTILSGLALLVGFYLVLQALEAAVVRRRSEIGILRSLGFTSTWIRTAWLVESFTLGLLGSGLGLIIGYFGAQFTVQGIARTVNTLYYSTTTSAAAWHHGEAAFAFGLGVAASLFAGWLPARDAAETPPAQVLRRGIRGQGIRLFDHPLLGVCLILLGALLCLLPPVELGQHVRFPAAGYAAALCWLVGASILFCNLFPWIARIFRPFSRSSASARYAVSQLRRPTGRHKLTVAGLVIAVGMAAGMAVLIKSFDVTMHRWINYSLHADIYVACKGVANASSRNLMRESTWRALAEDERVVGCDVGHIFPIDLAGSPSTLVGLRSLKSKRHQHFIWLDQPKADLRLDRARPDGAYPAWFSESFGVRYAKRMGDLVQLPTPAGEKVIYLAGRFADYGNERGSMVMDGARVSDWFGEPGAKNFAAYVKSGVSADKLRSDWAARFPGLSVRTNQRLREEILTIFRQTFSITYALKAIGVAVAIAGLAMALVSLLLERKRELATLKEVGATNRQIVGAVILESSAMALLGLVGGLLLSVALGALLIFVINKQSFGWTLGFALPYGGFAAVSAMIIAAAVFAGAITGRWGATLKGEREE